MKNWLYSILFVAVVMILGIAFIGLPATEESMWFLIAMGALFTFFARFGLFHERL